MVIFINNFIAQIQAAIGASDTTVKLLAADYDKLADLAGGDYYCAALNNGESIEYVHITAKATSPNITIERAKEGSTAISCDIGDTISIVNTAGMYEEFDQKSGVISTPKINEAVPLQATSSQLDDAVSKRHSQNTDTGTSEPSFTINLGANELKILSSLLTGNRDFTVPDADGLISVNTLIALNGTEIITY